MRLLLPVKSYDIYTWSRLFWYAQPQNATGDGLITLPWFRRGVIILNNLANILLKKLKNQTEFINFYRGLENQNAILEGKFQIRRDKLL